MKHLIVYYDRNCAFCLQCIEFLKKIDRKQLLTYQIQEQESDTVIFQEDAITWKYAKAVFRIFWVIGGIWKIVGCLYILPAPVIDPIYKIFARNRNCK